MDHSKRWHLERQGNCEKNKIVNLMQDKSLIGREEKCEICLVSKVISRKHCLIELEGGKMYITHQGGPNGTFVNDMKINERTEVKTGDTIGIGCNSMTSERNPLNEDFYQYKVKTGHFFETIELLDSDDDMVEHQRMKKPEHEKQEERPLNDSVETSIKEVKETGPDDVKKENADAVVVQDVEKLCDDLAENFCLDLCNETQNGLFNDDVIELSDEEEEIKYKKWETKLSQGKSPPLSHYSSQSDLSSDHSNAEELKKKVTKTESNDSIFETPEPSPESPSSQINQVNEVPMTSPDHRSEFTINISLLTEDEIRKHLSCDRDDDDRERKKTTRSTIKKKVLPSEKEKRLKTNEIKKMLDSICDDESDGDEERARNDMRKKASKTGKLNPKRLDSKSKSKKVRGVRNKKKSLLGNQKVPKIVKSRKASSSLSIQQEELECLSTGRETKTIFRRKSSAEVKTVTSPPNIQNKPTAEIQEKEVSKQLTITPKPKLTIEEVTERIMVPIKQQVPIIDATPMRKRRSSICATAQPKRRPTISDRNDVLVTSDNRPSTSKETKKRRQSVCAPQHIDMFAAAAAIRNESTTKIERRISVDQNETDLMLQMRRQKLRQIAEEEKQQYEAEAAAGASKAGRVVAKAKVKVTEKNRGDFLTELPVPPTAPSKKSSNVNTSLPRTVLVATTSKVAPKILPVPEYPKVSSPMTLISQFTEQHIKTSSQSTITSQAQDVSDDGYCNNVDFYRENQLNISPLGFYNPLNFSQNTFTPTVVKPSTEPVSANNRVVSKMKSLLDAADKNAAKKKVRFPDNQNLFEVRSFEPEDFQNNKKEEVIQNILKWNPKCLQSSESIDNASDNDCFYKDLLDKIRNANLRYSETNNWEYLMVMSFNAMPNGNVRLIMSYNFFHRGLKPGNLLLLKIKSPKTFAELEIETEKFGYIFDSTTNKDGETIITVDTNFNLSEINDIIMLKMRTVFFIQSEIDLLLELESESLNNQH